MPKSATGRRITAKVLLRRNDCFDQSGGADASHQGERHTVLCGRCPSDGKEHNDRPAKLPDIEDGRWDFFRHH